jgi:RNA-directed DNA polymerase
MTCRINVPLTIPTRSNDKATPTRQPAIIFWFLDISFTVRRPETFDFLGFTHYCSKSRDGKRFRAKRKTSAKKFRAKLAAFKEWIKRSRTQPTKWIWEQAAAKLRGHYAYFGVTDNSRSIKRFANEIQKLLAKWLNRRGKRSLNWEKFNRMLERYPLPKPRVRVSLFLTTRANA